MKAYSPDLCANIARAYNEGEGSQRQLARQFRASLAFSQKMRRRRATGNWLPRAAPAAADPC